jgi:hypothetical protein
MTKLSAAVTPIDAAMTNKNEPTSQPGVDIDIEVNVFDIR